MSERDELMDFIRAIDGPALLGGDVLADAILAAGYRKPRTITTPEELDTLGQDAVVRDANGVVYDRDRIVTYPHPLRWHPAGVAADVGSAFIELPATVLYEPNV